MCGHAFKCVCASSCKILGLSLEIEQHERGVIHYVKAIHELEGSGVNNTVQYSSSLSIL
jgi:hypothetical protein